MTSEKSIRADTDCSPESKTEESSSNHTTDKDTNKSTTESDDNNLDVDMLEPYSSRPTMISLKYRQKEERRKVLKVSMNKLRKIDDPESSLRRSVLINNTVKRLQREYREEKSQKYHHSLSYSSSKCFGISSDFITKQEENFKVFSTSMITSTRTSDQLLDITNLPDGKTCVTKCGSECLGCDEAMSELAFPGDHRASSLSNKLSSPLSRKRTIDETLEECDVLSQYCLPPTPRSIPCSEHHQQQDDDDEEVNVVDIDTTPVEPLAKRKREDCNCESSTYSQQDSIIACCLTAADRLRDNSPSTTSSSPSSLTSSPATFEDWITDENIMLQTVSIHQAPPSPYSCGQASIMNEIITYTNLIASFES